MVDSAGDFCYFFQCIDVIRRRKTHIEFLPLVIGGIFGYFLGSIPTAYLLVKWKSNIDIRTAGSRNVGTLNSFEVTKSKVVGGLVLFIDFVKGFGAVFFSGSLYGQVFGPMATAGIGAVVGHNFPLWLRFKGGRGLATAAGVMSMLCLPAVGIWIAGWVLGFSFMRKVNLSNVFATVGLVILLFVVSDDVLQSAVAEHPPAGSFRLFGSVLFFTILLKHIEPLRNHFFTRPGNQQVSEESP